MTVCFSTIKICHPLLVFASRFPTIPCSTRTAEVGGSTLDTMATEWGTNIVGFIILFCYLLRVYYNFSQNGPGAPARTNACTKHLISVWLDPTEISTWQMLNTIRKQQLRTSLPPHLIGLISWSFCQLVSSTYSRSLRVLQEALISSCILYGLGMRWELPGNKGEHYHKQVPGFGLWRVITTAVLLFTHSTRWWFRTDDLLSWQNMYQKEQL